jgi:organic radical activating enzyme
MIGSMDHAPADARPTLRYFEAHLVDHCNLNCRRCGHFSPLATASSGSFAAIESYTRDLTRLAELFSAISRIHLMGGEPLLHPGVGDFVRATRRAFPWAEICVVTNGILLPTIPERVWSILRDDRAVLRLSVYPLNRSAGRQTVEDYAESVVHRGIRVEVAKVEQFGAYLNVNGDSDPTVAMEACRKSFYCPFLADGRMYICVMPAKVRYFNEAYGQRIPDDGYVDIHAAGVTGRIILERLETPGVACRFCRSTPLSFDWTLGRDGPEDWVAARAR